MVCAFRHAVWVRGRRQLVRVVSVMKMIDLSDLSSGFGRDARSIGRPHHVHLATLQGQVAFAETESIFHLPVVAVECPAGTRERGSKLFSTARVLIGFYTSHLDGE